MTRSKFRRTIRETIAERLNDRYEDDLRELVTKMTDAMVDYFSFDHVSAGDRESCFEEFETILKEANLNPETIGEAILKADRESGKTTS